VGAARGTHKELGAEGFLQRLDGARQRRLLEMQSLSRASEVEFFRDGQETTEVAKLHARLASFSAQLLLCLYAKP
jgi:hypothetical protein